MPDILTLPIFIYRRRIMGRPPKSSEAPEAKERMESVFWECLEEKPFDKITVRDVVERAGVNRNTYYYHYASMDDLAKSAIGNTIAVEFANMIITREPETSGLLRAMSRIENKEERFGRIRLMAGPHGSPQLLNYIKGIISNEWLHAYGLSEGDMTDGARTAIGFVFGGITTLWADRSIGFEETFTSILSTDLIAYNIRVLRDELEKSARLAHKTSI